MRLALSLAVALAGLCEAQSVQITWIGQACFYVQTENGPLVVTDPPAANIGYALPATPADAVTISHNHADHNNSAGVRGAFQLVDGRDLTQRRELTVGAVPFVQVPGFHDPSNGTARGRNTIVVWTQGGLRFAHFGDFGQDALTATQLADLQNIDVMMIPAGGLPFTTEIARLPALLDQVRPRITVLMHYRTGFGGGAQLPAAPAVANPFSGVRFLPSSVALSRATMPASPEVWVMEPAADAVTVNAATNISGPPVAPGSLAIFWGNFGSIADAVSGVPLLTKLRDAEVVIGNTAVPLLYASSKQINFQVPSNLAPGQYAIETRVGGQRVARGVITVAERGPGIFLAVDQLGRVNRARRGAFLTLYGTGQGATFNTPRDGTAAAASPLSQSTVTPNVLLAGRRLNVSFSGLAPNFVGLWQINAEVPADAPTGNGAVTVQFDTGVVSNTVPIVID